MHLGDETFWKMISIRSQTNISWEKYWPKGTITIFYAKILIKNTLASFIRPGQCLEDSWGNRLLLWPEDDEDDEGYGDYCDDDEQNDFDDEENDIYDYHDGFVEMVTMVKYTWWTAWQRGWHCEGTPRLRLGSLRSWRFYCLVIIVMLMRTIMMMMMIRAPN